jgi:hypothetical protein
MQAMTSRERYIIWGLICVVVATGVFPPWAVRGYPAGYHLIFAPPSNRGAIHIDQSRLMIEWIISAVIAAGLYRAWPTRRARSPDLLKADAPWDSAFFFVTGTPASAETTYGKLRATGMMDEGAKIVFDQIDGPTGDQKGLIKPLKIWKAYIQS